MASENTANVIKFLLMLRNLALQRGGGGVAPRGRPLPPGSGAGRLGRLFGALTTRRGRVRFFEAIRNDLMKTKKIKENANKETFSRTTAEQIVAKIQKYIC